MTQMTIHRLHEYDGRGGVGIECVWWWGGGGGVMHGMVTTKICTFNLTRKKKFIKA